MLGLGIDGRMGVETGSGFDCRRSSVNFWREMKFGNAVLQSIAVAEFQRKSLTWIEGVSSGIERDPSALDGLPQTGGDSKA